MRLAANLIAVVALAPYTALAWGTVGHEVVATIAQIHLHPSVFKSICPILNYTSPDPSEPPCHLAPIAAWADRLRWKMRWSASLHYVGALGDHPSETCIFPGERGWAGRKGGHVLGAIGNTSRILEAGSDWGTENEALKFLVHFMGDVHMPLHLTGRDRGGNGDKVLFDGRQTNLHSLWDSLLISKSLRTIPYNYTTPLPLPLVEYNLRETIYDPYIRRLVWEGILGRWKDQIEGWLDCPAPESASSGSQQVMSTYSDESKEWDNEVVCPYFWSAPIHSLNCDLVWPKALDEPPYNGRNHHLSEGEHEHEHFMTAEEEVAQFSDSGAFVAGATGGPYLELDTPEYAGVIHEQWIIEELLTQAGIRLAGVLNWLYADVEEERFGPWVETLTNE